MASLQAAFTFAQVDHGPVLVSQDLDLDVARSFDVALDEQPVVAEGLHGLAPGGGDLRRDVRPACTIRMPLPPPPAEGRRAGYPPRRPPPRHRNRSCRRRGDPVRPGPLAAATRRLAAILSPMLRIAATGGPMKVIPSASRSRKGRGSHSGIRSRDGWPRHRCDAPPP